jgi:hypothetical protein
VPGGNLVRAQFGRQDGCTDIFQKPPLRDDVAHVRDVVQRDGLWRQQRRSHAGQSRVFSAANLHPPAQGAATRYPKFIHRRQIVK